MTEMGPRHEASGGVPIHSLALLQGKWPETDEVNLGMCEKPPVQVAECTG